MPPMLSPLKSNAAGCAAEPCYLASPDAVANLSDTAIPREKRSMRAGGTIPQVRVPSLLTGTWLFLEMALLFGAAPILMTWLVHGERIPLLSEYIPAGTKIPIFVALLPVLFIAAF